MTDPAIDALKRLVRREYPDASLPEACKALADQMHVNWRALHHIVTDTKLPSGRPRGVGRELREKLERHYSGWMGSPSQAVLATAPDAQYTTTVQRITPGSTGKSQSVRLTEQKMAPPKIGWEALMTTDLPREFETQLPDAAMAPRAGRGARCILVTDVEPLPGDWVLLSDKDGTLYVREYRQLRGTLWEAHAVNPAFMPLHNQRDGLRVLAVVDGIRQRMSAAG